jgi:phenylacetate-CoA ligase
MDYVTTGGTGGVPLGFYINGDRSHKEYAYLVSSWNMAGFKLGDTKCVLRGKKINAKSHGMYYTYDPLFREHYYSNFHTSEEDLTKYVEHIKQVGDCHIHAYPSSIYMLTRFMKSHDIPAPANVKSIILESENIYEDQREFVEQFFGCRCYSMYGHSEKLIAGAECAKCTDYHIWPTYGYMELLDEKERPVGEIGNRGEIIGTGFINTVQPFIRYRTGDYAEFAGNTCQICGKNHTVIRDIRGHRIQEYLVASDGSLVPWAAVNMHDNTFDNIRQYQFFQEKQGEILIRVVVSNNYREDDGKRIISNINQKLGEKFKIDLQIVNTIKLTNRGKSVFVVQKILSDL